MTAALLQRLIDATPLPPSALDVDALLAAFERVLAARQAIIDEVTGVRPIITDDEHRLLHELVARQDAWRDALITAQRLVCERRLGSRAYAAQF